MKDSAFDHLRRATDSYQESSVLTAAAELDLFTEILKQGNRGLVSRLSDSLDADFRALTALLDVLAAIGYLSKTNEAGDAVYSVEDRFREFLDSRMPQTFIPMLRHIAAVHRVWTQIAHTVKSGRPPVPQGSFLGAEQEDVAFIWAMNSVARTLAGPTIESLRSAGVLSFEKEEVRFLDVGGASGTYTQSILEAMPKWRGAIFDRPVGIDAARKRFQKSGEGAFYQGRVEFFEGDFYKDELPAGYDFVWISAIIHQHGLKESAELFAKAFRATNSSGKIAVRDFMMNSNRTAPADGAFFGINMLVETETGMVYTFEEVRDLLLKAGFVDVQLAVPMETMSAVVVARKP
jgi:hypothetical protein